MSMSMYTINFLILVGGGRVGTCNISMQQLTVLLLNFGLVFCLFAAGSASPTPIVLVHGFLGSSNGSNFLNLEHQILSLARKYGRQPPRVIRLQYAEGPQAAALSYDDTYAEFIGALAAHYRVIRGGFHVVAASQGGMLVRTYIERLNVPKVKTFITIHSPLNGIGACPRPVYPPTAAGTILSLLCKRYKRSWGYDVYGQGRIWAPAAYWRRVRTEEEYEEFKKRSTMLAVLNNEGQAPFNPAFKAHMEEIESLIMIMSRQDEVIFPSTSQVFGGWEVVDAKIHHGEYPGELGMEDSLLYREDKIGLRTLDKTGRLHVIEYSYSMNGKPQRHLDWPDSQVLVPLITHCLLESREGKHKLSKEKSRCVKILKGERYPQLNRYYNPRGGECGDKVQSQEGCSIA